MGVVFAMGGLAVWGMAGRQYQSNQRQVNARRLHPGNAAMADYAWNPSGYAVPRWPRAVKAVIVAGVLTLFLSAFNFWAFFAGGNWFVKACTILFDLILLLVWADAAVRVLRAAKFGGSRVAGTEFPCRQLKPLRLQWHPASGIAQLNRGTFTLRCVEEWYESIGHDDSPSLVQEELWSATWHVDSAQRLARGEVVELRFEPPASLPRTQLSGKKPIFWDLEVKLDLPGLDFEEVYLVPVY